MNRFDLPAIVEFIESNIGPDFHDKKIEKLRALNLEGILKRKNPYLFKAKKTDSAHDLIKAILDATASSGEETVFGNFLEKVAIEVCRQVHGGRKSGIKGLDLEFEEGDTKYLVSIKSGPNWGNSSQIKAMIRAFNEAKKTLVTSGGLKPLSVVCIEACCYGTDVNPEKGTHRRLCGQLFWEFVSGGNVSLYQDIIEPLGHKAKEKNEEIDLLYHAKLNVFVQDFVTRFCNDGVIDWDRLVAYNSGKRNT
jgi:hypothetical protein